MRLIKRYFACSPLEKRLFRQAVALHLAVRIGLWALPFRTVARLVTRAAHRPPHRQPADATVMRDTVVWAVTRGHRYGPSRGACLQEALVGQIMLSRHGFPSQLRIGVRKNESGEVQAHAWVENRGDVVIGGPRSQVAEYTELRNMERLTPGG